MRGMRRRNSIPVFLNFYCNKKLNRADMRYYSLGDGMGAQTYGFLTKDDNSPLENAVLSAGTRIPTSR